MNGYIDDNNANKHLTSIRINEKHGKLSNKREYLIKSKSNNPDDYKK